MRNMCSQGALIGIPVGMSKMNNEQTKKEKYKYKVIVSRYELMESLSDVDKL